MKISIFEELLAALTDYAQIPIAYEVRKVLDVKAIGAGRFAISARDLNAPYLKDYDAIKGEGPAQWAKRFNLSNWTILGAQMDGRRVGGAAIAFKTAGLRMLEDRDDLAVLWDIRVSPEARGKGVGTALFRAAERWAAKKGCERLKVETQNVNVPACRFYEAQGCVLETINHFAYPQFPEEIQMLWYKDVVSLS